MRLFRKFLKVLFLPFMVFVFYLNYLLFLEVGEKNEPLKTVCLGLAVVSLICNVYGTRLYFKVFFHI